MTKRPMRTTACLLALLAGALGGCTADISAAVVAEDGGTEPDAEAGPTARDAESDSTTQADAALDASVEPDANADAGGPPMTYVCSGDGWCVARPLPTADGLRGAFATSDDEVWMVGEGGSVIAFDGVGFRRVSSAVDVTLHAAFSTAKGSAWVVGEAGTVLRYVDGALEAQEFEVPNADAGASGKAAADLFAVHGAADDDVWLVGDLGAAWHFDGSSFEARHLSSAQPLRAVWSDGANTLAVGDGGSAFLFNPGDDSWMLLPTGTSANLSAIAGHSANDLWVVGAAGSVLHYDGESFESLDAPSADNLFAAAVRTDGTLWVAGQRGALFSHDGTSWSPRSSGLDTTLRALVHTGEVLWTLGDHGSVASWQDEARTVHSEGGDESWLDLVPIDDDTMWVVGDGLLQGMPLVPLEPPSARVMFAGFGLSPDALWLAGTYGTAFYWDGASWTELPVLTRRGLRGVWAADPAHVFLVGERGVLMTPNDEGELALVDTPDARDLLSVWGSSERDVWAVGTLGTVAHYDGSEWSLLAGGETYSLNGVYAAAEDDVYVVGARGTLLHYDGEAFVPEDVGSDVTLHAVNAHAGRIYASGANGLLLFRE